MSRQRRFVLLLHETPDGYRERTHWDWMFESENALITWATPPLLPVLEIRQRTDPPLESFECPVQRLPDHRIAYLDYEGPVSRNRGSVTRLDSGIYMIDFQDQESVPNRYRVRGTLLHGLVSIDRFDENHLTALLNFKRES